MSADNWAICPWCAKRRQAKIEQAEALYGKVPREDFEAALAAAMSPQERTFREDYEIYGADSGGTVKIGYSGHCQVCGLGTDFTHEHELGDLDA